MIFSQTWFTRHQKILLWFANSWIGRRILCINGQKSSVGKNKIIKILPNSITWKTGRKYHTEFRSGNKFANRIRSAFYPVWYLLHLWDMFWYPKFNLGFDELTQYAGAGDGYVDVSDASWDTGHDAITGGSAVPAASPAYTQAQKISGGNYIIRRCFWPFDTSSIGAGKTISSAVLGLYVEATSDGDNDGNDFVTVVQTSQANSATLATADFDQCGAIDNPAEGVDNAQRKDITSVSSSAYLEFTLNSTGIGFISKTGTTLLGTREGHDALDHAPADNTNTYIQVSTSENAGTTQDPKLVVTYTLPMGGYIFISS